MTDKELIKQMLVSGLTKIYESEGGFENELTLKQAQMLHKKVNSMLKKLGYGLAFDYPEG